MEESRRKGQMGLNCCFRKSKIFVSLLQWEGQGASTLLCCWFYFILYFNKEELLLGAISVVALASTQNVFTFLIFDSRRAGLEVKLIQVLRKGVWKRWRQFESISCWELTSTLWGGRTAQMAFSIWNHLLQRQGSEDTFCSFQLLPKIS